MHQTVYEVVHFAAGERVLPSGLDPFWAPAAAPTTKSNSVQFRHTKAHVQEMQKLPQGREEWVFAVNTSCHMVLVTMGKLTEYESYLL